MFFNQRPFGIFPKIHPIWKRDPSLTWSHLDHLVPLELVTNLATSWHHLPFAWTQFCQPLKPLSLFANFGGATCTDWKFGHQKKPLASFANWATIICICSKFGHEISPQHWFQSRPPGCLTCIATLSTRWRHLPPASRFVLHFNVQMTGSILKAGTMF